MNLPDIYPKSPLRYPGGKGRAVKTITAFIPDDVTELCSPFFGGGSIELACSANMRVYGSDAFEPLASFWYYALHNNELLVQMVRAYYPMTKQRFQALQNSCIELHGGLVQAASFFVLNRSSFSGTTSSGGMSPGTPRFNKPSIARLASLVAPNLTVECLDYRESLRKYPDMFLYLDPPYKNGGSLYGMRGDKHKGFDHKEFHRIIHNRERWILSYNNSDEIRELYLGHPMVSVNWTYGMSNDKSSKEILIFSRDTKFPA